MIRLAGAFDLTRRRTCLILFLLLATPTLAGLSVIIGPFQGLDESSHFYRAVQFSYGRAFPVVAPDGKAAGDRLDSGVHRLGGYFLFLSYHDWWKPFGAGRDDLRAAWRQPLTGRDEFVPFSNTVIYFPLAHAAPAAAIAILRALHTRPLAWLYAARLVDAALALALFAAAIWMFAEGRAFVFVLALLPRTLFTTAALSADTLLVPCAALFAALVARLARTDSFCIRQYALLGFAMAYLCLAKIAYVPLAVLPALTAMLAAGRLDRRARHLLLLGAGTVLLWLLWAATVHDAVFPIRTDVAIDVHAQLQQVLSHPLRDVEVLLRTLRHQGAGYVDNLVGGQLGSESARFSHLSTGITWLVLAAAAVLATERPAWRWADLAATGTVVVGTALVVFLLLYLQFSAIGAPMVDGVQGRYFVPLLPLLVRFLPRIRLSPRTTGLAGLAVTAWMALACADTLSLMLHRYWLAQPATPERYDDSRIMQSQ